MSWVLGLGEHARLLDPSELVDEAAERLATILERHTERSPTSSPSRSRAAPTSLRATGTTAWHDRDGGHGDTPIRPERFARLVALAGILIQSARGDAQAARAEVCERLQITEQELREDLDVLNVVNFGGGSYVLYAEIQGDEIEVDPEPYSDNFARPARLLPLEAKALIAAIDLLGDHLPEGSLASARQKIVDRARRRPVARGPPDRAAGRRRRGDVAHDQPRDRGIAAALDGVLQGERGRVHASARSSPTRLINGEEGWYVFSYDLDREDTRHFRLDRIKRAKLSRKTFEPRPEVDPTADLEGWPRTGAVPGITRRARVDLARAGALGARAPRHRGGARRTAR